MLKAIGAAEGLGRLLNPDFKIITHAEPFIKRIQLSRYNPKRMANEVLESGSEFFDLLKEIPGEFGAIIKQAREGRVKNRIAA